MRGVLARLREDLLEEVEGVWVEMEGDHECVVVYNYHPMYIMRGREDDPTFARRRLLFKATLSKLQTPCVAAA